MMSKKISVLGGLFAFQALMFGVLYRSSGSSNSSLSGKGSKPAPLTTLTFDQIDHISVEDGNKKILHLEKKDQKWVLPDRWDFPVSEAKLKETLEKLISVETSWPVGSTAIAAKQFQVTEDKFEGRIIYSKGADVLAKVYLGSSPSFKKIHARVDGQDNTFAIEFNSHDLPADPQQWFHKTSFERKRADVKTLAWKDITLENSNNLFTLSGLSADKEVDSVQVDSLLLTALNPDFEDILGKEEADFLSLTEVLTYTLTMINGDTAAYSFREMKSEVKKEGQASTPENNEFVAARISGQPYTFKVRKSRIENMIQATKEKLEKKKGEIASAQDQGPQVPAVADAPNGVSDSETDVSSQEGDDEDFDSVAK